MSFLVCNHLADLERVGCYILLIVLLSHGCLCYVSLGAMLGIGLQSLIVSFPGYIHVCFVYIPYSGLSKRKPHKTDFACFLIFDKYKFLLSLQPTLKKIISLPHIDILL